MKRSMVAQDADLGKGGVWQSGLMRQIRNLFLFEGTGSNPVSVDYFSLFVELTSLGQH